MRRRHRRRDQRAQGRLWRRPSQTPTIFPLWELHRVGERWVGEAKTLQTPRCQLDAVQIPMLTCRRFAIDACAFLINLLGAAEQIAEPIHEAQIPSLTRHALP